MRSIEVERRRGHVALHTHGHWNPAAIDACELLRQCHVVPIVRARPAVLLRVRQAEEPEIAGLLKNVVRGEYFSFLPGIDVGIDFLVDEPADGFTKKLMGFREARARHRSLRTGFE